MPLPTLTVKFSGDHHATFANTDLFVCVSFAGCQHWEATKLISWENLPTTRFAIFYETDTCRTGGKYYYISKVAETKGSHKFYSAQIIRPFMFGNHNDYGRRPLYIFRGYIFEERTSIGSTAGKLNHRAAFEINRGTDASASAGGSLFELER